MKRVHNIIYVALAGSVMQFSCSSDYGLQDGISNIFKPAVLEIEKLNKALILDSTFSITALVNNDSTFHENEFQIMYNENKSFWFTEYGLNENGLQLLENIKQANTEGLKPEDYLYDELDSLATQIEDLNITQLKDLELKLSFAYLKYGKHLLLGKIEPLSIDKNWQNKNDTTWSIDSMRIWVNQDGIHQTFEKLRPAHPWYKKFRSTTSKLKKLKTIDFSRNDLTETDLQIGDSTASILNVRMLLANVSDSTLNQNSMVWDNAAEGALRAFQYDFGLNETGIFDSATRAFFDEDIEKNIARLGMNMERMRWLVKDFDKEYIWVNIAEMQVQYFEGDSMTFKMNAVVGKLSRKTPTLDSRLSDIVFNPPWYVPPTILRNDILPGIARRGGSYLRRKGLVARDGRGRIVNPSRINSKNYRRYSISQNPGRWSALGSVKFNFPNKEAIFLHDTNHRWGFDRKVRASSSGCIRVQHPKDFARFILRDSTFSASNIDSIIDQRKTKSIDINRDIGVHIVYLTNAIDSVGRVVKVQDIYKWDEKLGAQL